MTRYTSEQVQEIVEEKEAEYKQLEEEYSDLEEEYSDLKEYCGELKSENDELETRKERFKREIAILERKCKSYEKANKTILCIYHEDSKKMEDLQKLNNKLVKSCKKANRDFFILAAAYVATLVLMIYLFIR